MKARDVLRRYGAGERDFRGANLRGLSFKGECLAGADFSGADIRGTDFTGADLTGVKFCGAKAGLPEQRVVVNLIIALLILGVSSFLSGLFGAFRFYLFADPESFLARWVIVGIILPYCIFTIRRGVVVGIGVFSIAVALVIVLALSGDPDFMFNMVMLTFLAGIGTRTGTLATTLGGAGTIAVAVAGAGITALAGAFVVAVASAGARITTFVVAFPITIVFAIVGALTLAFVEGGGVISSGTIDLLTGVNEKGLVFSGAIDFAVLLTGVNLYLAQCATIHHDSHNPWIRSIVVAFAAWGGTSFRGSDLTEADFSKAQLKCCDFRPGKIKHKSVSTQLIRTCFQNTTKLDLSRPGQTILADPIVCALLIKPEKGHNQNFVHAHLFGAYLQGANLENANLKGTNLHHADLSGANLKNANLRKANVLDANFTSAYLTGAYIGSWNIDTHTRFKSVDCQYIYLYEQPNELGSYERRPHDPNKVFAPGDFERLYTQLMHTVEILLKGGMNRDAFAAAFQKISEENPEITWDSIQSIEKKGEDVLLMLEVPPDTDKAQVEQTFDAAYVARLEAQAEAQALRAQDMKDIALALANKEQNITANAINRPSQMDVHGSAYGVAGEVRGDQITQSEGGTPNSQTLLSALQEMIDTGDLSDEDRAKLKTLLEADRNQF